MVLSYLRHKHKLKRACKTRLPTLRKHAANIQTFFDMANLFILFFTKNANNLCLSTPNSPVKKNITMLLLTVA